MVQALRSLTCHCGGLVSIPDQSCVLRVVDNVACHYHSLGAPSLIYSADADAT